jgi:threonine dehydratase
MGGGGLLGGVGTAIRALKPGCKIYAAEPENAAPLSTSLAAGKASRYEKWSRSWVDGAGGQTVLESMFPIVKSVVDESIIVPLDDAAAAMKMAAQRVRIIIEGAAACAVAAAMSPTIKARGHKKVVAIVSGGNIDLARFASLVGACA